MIDGQHGPAEPAPGTPWDTTRLRDGLRLRYMAPIYALLEEVANGTGARGNRYADAIVMQLYPSMGLELLGFEVKASRTDWLNELKDPAKSAAFIPYCDAWYLVIADEGMVKPGELPANWGMIAPRGSLLQIVKPAPTLPARSMDRTFLAALLRRVHESAATPRELEAEYTRGCRDGWKFAEGAKAELKRYRRRLVEIRTNAMATITATDHMLRHAPKD